MICVLEAMGTDVEVTSTPQSFSETEIKLLKNSLRKDAIKFCHEILDFLLS